MKKVVLDFESYYTKADFSLSKMQTDAYVLSPDFEVIGIGAKVDDGKTSWRSGDDAYIRQQLGKPEWWSEVAVVCHNTLFDGFILSQRYGIRPKLWIDTLAMARGLYPWLPSHSLKAVAAYLGVGVKGTEVDDADGKRRLDFTPEELAAYGEYCKNDVELTYAIYKIMEPHFPVLEFALVDMTVRMFTEPAFKLDKDKIVAYREQIIEDKAKLLSASGSSLAQLMSNPQFAAELEKLGVNPPMKTSKTTGKWTYAFAKTDKGLTDLLECGDTGVELLVAARLGNKTTIAETRAQKLIETANRGIGFPIYLNYWGAKCVPGSTEVLTKNGWVPIADWSGEDEIAQVAPNGDISFLPAARFVGTEEAEWVDIDAPYLKCSFTKGHTMPYLKHESFAWGAGYALDMMDRASWYAPTAGVLQDGGAIDPHQMRVLAMVQAYGSYVVGEGRSPRLKIAVKKPRKIERAAELLRAAEVPFYTKEYPSQPGYTVFFVAARDLPNWLGPHRKNFGAWILDSTADARRAFVLELPLWDGWCEKEGVIWYCSVDRGNVDWAATVCHLVGWSASISTKPPSGKKQVCYVLRVRKRGHCLVRKEHQKLAARRGIPYCATTKTGFFLARSEGHVFVTGNTTGRYSGGNKINCLVGETGLTILRNEEVLCIMLSALRDTDLVWDGQEFVEHGGLVFQGYKEVLTYGGITGTADHKVFVVGREEPVELASAAEQGLVLQDGGYASRVGQASENMSNSERQVRKSPQPSV